VSWKNRQRESVFSEMQAKRKRRKKAKKKDVAGHLSVRRALVKSSLAGRE
jgi:hypothetical protein